MTNGDKIRTMSDEDLAMVLMCPYDTAGEPINIMPCVKQNGTNELAEPKFCHACVVEWLQREVHSTETASEPEWKKHMMNRFMKGE